MSHRSFEIQTTSHGPDDLWVARLRGHEALSSLYRFDLVVIASEPELEDVLLGQRATIRMRNATSERSIHGIVARASTHPRFRHQEGASLRLRVVPLLWTLGLEARSRIFQDRTVPEIVADVLQRGGIPMRWSLAREHAPRPYCVQYRESDLDFVQRLLAEEGIFTFFEPLEDDDRLVLADGADGYPMIDGDPSVPFRPDRAGATGEHLRELGWTRKLRPRAPLRGALDEQRTHFDREPGSEPATRLANVAEGERPFHAWDGLRTGEEATRIEIERARRSSDVVEGEGSLVRAAPGRRFSVKGPPTSSLERGLAIVEVETTGWQPVVGVAAPSPESSRTPLHACRLRCVGDDVAHRPAPRPRPAPSGLETATVVGPVDEEVHTDAWGRIQIRFPWDVRGLSDEQTSCWVRTSQPRAGSAGGVGSPPRVGMGVIVGFLANDPDRPVVLGTPAETDC